MDRVGEVKSSPLLGDEPFFYEQENEVPTASTSFNSTYVESSIHPHSKTSASSPPYDPCVNAVSEYVCISYLQLAIICVACFTIILMIVARVFCCCVHRRRERKKRVPDILAMEDDMIRHTRLNSISTITGNPPPRYSQIFDQDGISVFEEAPPDYETAQPDLLKSLPQDLSRTSSLAGKGESSERSQESDTERTSTDKVQQDASENGHVEPIEKLKLPPKQGADSVISLSVDTLLHDSTKQPCS